MTEDPCKDCKIHGRIEESLENVKGWQDDVKEWQKTITNTLTHIVTAKSAWAFFVVFLSVCLAVIGFLWRGQLSIWESVNLNNKIAIEKMESLKTQIGVIGNKVDLIDYKVQTHLDETLGISNRWNKEMKQYDNKMKEWDGKNNK